MNELHRDVTYFQMRTKVEELLSEITEFADRETDLIFEVALGKNKMDCLFSTDKVGDDVFVVQNIVRKRQKRIPLQYILGKAYFRNLELTVSEGVLIPRPETELLVDWAMEDIKRQLQHKRQIRVLDMGTGSGAIAAAVASEYLDWNGCDKSEISIDAVDVSEKALNIARENLLDYDFVSVIQSDMFERVDEKYDLILSNPPYIAESERSELAPEVAVYEPELALFAGDGLEFYRKFIREMPNYLKEGASFIFEIGAEQFDGVNELVKERFKREANYILDYSKRRRFICMTGLV